FFFIYSLFHFILLTIINSIISIISIIIKKMLLNANFTSNINVSTKSVQTIKDLTQTDSIHASFNKDNNGHTTTLKNFKKDVPELTLINPKIQIRILSLADYLNHEKRPEFLKEMRKSLMEIGTFYIKDHQVPAWLTQRAMSIIKEYFELP